MRVDEVKVKDIRAERVDGVKSLVIEDEMERQVIFIPDEKWTVLVDEMDKLR